MPATLLGLTAKEIADLVADLGESRYRGRQIARWLYKSGVRSFDRMKNLPPALRSKLDQNCLIGRSEVIAAADSPDGTRKLLLRLHDGETVETVGIPSPDRYSCCVSTQVGCPIGCTFCATGLGGYTRNLTAGEIVDQVLTVQEGIPAEKASDKHGRVSHVVFMGMGEPLLNYDATLKAVRLLNDELGIAMRHLTVSTIGHVPGILKFAGVRLQLTLAVSLHAPDDVLRRKLVPLASQWPVADIVGACHKYVRVTGRRITFEYCLIRDLNDRPSHAQQLADLLRGLNCHVNLIPFNRVKDLPHRSPTATSVKTFREILEHAGIQVTQRVQRGAGIDAACGQLRSRTAGPTR